MAEEQLVVFKLGTEEYAIPIFEVREIIRYNGATKLPNTPMYMEGIINLRGKVVPVINIANRFGQSFEMGNEPKVIIIESSSQDIGIIVNEVTEVLRIADNHIEPPPTSTSHNYIRGIGKIKERLLILLNLKNLFSEQELNSFA